MADYEQRAAFLRVAHKFVETLRNHRLVGRVVEEAAVLQRGHSGFARRVVGYALARRAAVYEEQPAALEHLHERFHQLAALGSARAAVVVDADNARQRVERLRHLRAHFVRGHSAADYEFPRLRIFVGLRLHRKVQDVGHGLRCRELRSLFRVLAVGHYRPGRWNLQRGDALGQFHLASAVVYEYRQQRRSVRAGITAYRRLSFRRFLRFLRRGQPFVCRDDDPLARLGLRRGNGGGYLVGHSFRLCELRVTPLIFQRDGVDRRRDHEQYQRQFQPEAAFVLRSLVVFSQLRPSPVISSSSSCPSGRRAPSGTVCRPSCSSSARPLPLCRAQALCGLSRIPRACGSARSSRICRSRRAG